MGLTQLFLCFYRFSNKANSLIFIPDEDFDEDFLDEKSKSQNMNPISPTPKTTLCKASQICSSPLVLVSTY